MTFKACRPEVRPGGGAPIASTGCPMLISEKEYIPFQYVLKGG